MQNQLTGAVKRVAKLEAPRGLSASAGKAARGRTVFFSEEEDGDDEEDESDDPKPPVRKMLPREAERRGTRKQRVELQDDQIALYVDSADSAVGGGGRGIAGLQEERKKAEAAPLQRWENIVAKCSEITEVDGGGGVMTYFKLHTNIKYHRLALKYLHSIVHISRSTNEPKVLGHCANALVFLD